jgi:hypothetical protein
MIIELKKINSCVEKFGDEIYKTHLAYASDKILALQKAKEIIEDIIENGLEEVTVVRFPKIREINKVSYTQLCERFTTINLEYIFQLFGGGELRWALY